jgi:hypothetical protein
MWMGKLEKSVSKKKSPKGKVIGVFDYLMEWLTDVSFRGCGWQNIITDLPSDHDKIKDQAIFHKNELRSWIHEQLMAEAEYTNLKAKDLGDQIIVLVEGAIILSQIQKDSWPIKTAQKACKKILI